MKSFVEEYMLISYSPATYVYMVSRIKYELRYWTKYISVLFKIRVLLIYNLPKTGQTGIWIFQIPDTWQGENDKSFSCGNVRSHL